MAENLCSLFIIVMGSSMFLNFIILSGRIMDRAKQKEEELHRAVSVLETMEEDSFDDGIVKKDDLGELTVSIHLQDGSVISEEYFPVYVYYSSYGAIYRREAMGPYD